MKHWGKKAPGIVAKMMTTLKPSLLQEAFGIRLNAKGGSLGCWKHILTAKFQQNEVAKKRLLATAPHTLVEQARFPRDSNYWDAFVSKDGQTLVGRNMMGRMLQLVRDGLLPSE